MASNPDTHGSQTSPNLDDVLFDENTLYCSEDPIIFRVSALENQASKRCNLSGTYDLLVNTINLVLADAETQKAVFVWPYRYIRRYGKSRSNFTFEAGRKCQSGEGLFSFLTTAGDEIFSKVYEKLQDIKTRDGKTKPKLNQRGSMPSVKGPALPDRKYLPQTSGCNSLDRNSFDRSVSEPISGQTMAVFKQVLATQITGGNSHAGHGAKTPPVRAKPKPAVRPPVARKPQRTLPTSNEQDSIYAEPDETPVFKGPGGPVYDDADTERKTDSWTKYAMSESDMVHEEHYQPAKSDLSSPAGSVLPLDCNEYDHITLRLEKVKLPNNPAPVEGNLYGQLSQDAPEQEEQALYSPENEYQTAESVGLRKDEVVYYESFSSK